MSACPIIPARRASHRSIPTNASQGVAKHMRVHVHRQPCLRPGANTQLHRANRQWRRSFQRTSARVPDADPGLLRISAARSGSQPSCRTAWPRWHDARFGALARTRTVRSCKSTAHIQAHQFAQAQAGGIEHSSWLCRAPKGIVRAKVQQPRHLVASSVRAGASWSWARALRARIVLGQSSRIRYS